MKIQMVRCLMCGESMPSDAEGYAAHTRAKHSVGLGFRITPERSTNRTTAEIVADVEHKMKDFIFVPEDLRTPRKEHEESCRCEQCFNAQLDKILAGQHITWKGANDEPIRADAEN